jgi:putative membrane protein
MTENDQSVEPSTLQDVASTDRTVLANERTLASWLRTGLAALVAALAIQQYLVSILPTWNRTIIVTALLAFSVVSFVLASWRYTHVHIRLQEHDVETIPRLLVRIVCYGLAACSLLATWGIWSLNSLT